MRSTTTYMPRPRKPESETARLRKDIKSMLEDISNWTDRTLPDVLDEFLRDRVFAEHKKLIEKRLKLHDKISEKSKE